VDEIGYLTYGTDAANVLFHVVNDRHRRKRAMIFTTNKPLTAWGHVLHDEDLAHAIIDRDMSPKTWTPPIVELTRWRRGAQLKTRTGGRHGTSHTQALFA
jgi:hypothetical protein